MMSPDILLAMKNSVNKASLISPENVDYLINKFGIYKSGGYISPIIVKKHLGVSTETAYELLNVLLEDGILVLAFEVHCKCGEVYPNIFNKINEIPKAFECEECGHEIDKLKDVRGIFRVI